MTLLHAFVRDEFAKMKQLVIPVKIVPVQFEEIGKTWNTTVQVPAETWNIAFAEAERRFEEVQPDVYYELDTQAKIALEVRYAHAVEEAKVEKLRRVVSMCAEFDVSDLPAAGIGSVDFERLLSDPARWKWLLNGRIAWETTRLKEELRWKNSSWRLKARPISIPNVLTKAAVKLKKAESRLPWARLQLAKLKAEKTDPTESMHWLGAQDKVDRVAVACAALGFAPTALSDFFNQSLEGKNVWAVGHHPYSWQVVLFMKFGIGYKQFSGHTAADWMLIAMPDRTEMENGSKSTNGFTRTAAALQIYFLNLEVQGMLDSDKTQPLENRTFKPRFSRTSELREFLAVTVQ
ncbi:hypothetical protein [Rhodoferax sp. OV413]|uniref:hypothetical protein n=1 Tax=Rhodoferax sp. OV413 TaxID=1855285 RepID=UPI000B84555B|nr:hypothetical protein [Rhodoferax sp. OV413]